MAMTISTCYGDVIVKDVYDYDTGSSYFDVYEPEQYDEECGYGKWIGDFFSKFSYLDEGDEYDYFIEDLEHFLSEQDYMELPKYKRRSVRHNLESLLHKRFNKETLEKELSKIFYGEEIHIELIEDDNGSIDWNYIFTSEQDDIAGDFDVYVLFHKNEREGFDGATFMVTEVAYDFHNNGN